MDPLTLIDLDSRSDEIAIVSADGQQLKSQLLGQAAAVGLGLGEVAAGAQVIVTLDSGPRFVAALAGCWLAGATPVLLDPLVRHELGQAVEATDAHAVLSGPAPPEFQLPDNVVSLVPNGAVAAPWRAPAVDPDTPLVGLFTSGSTGEPTLVFKSFSQLDVEVRFLTSLLERPQRVATLVPWCHIFGFIVAFLLPLRLGGVCDLTAGISPRLVLQRAGAGLLDLVVAVPAIYRVMVRLLESGGLLPIPMNCRFVCSGAPLPPQIRSRFTELTGRPIIDLYGSTEAGGVAYRSDDGPWIPQPHVDWRVTPGGFLEVRSPSVSTVPSGEFYRIGDLVRQEGRGFVLEGRADDVVKIGGRRVSLDEVQQVVEACPSVLAAAVLALKLRGELRLVAIVEPTQEQIDEHHVRSYVRTKLADHKVPRAVRLIDRLPRTPAGKVDRRAIARQLTEED